MQAGHDQRAAGFDTAGDALAGPAMRTQGDDGRFGGFPIAFLQWRLRGAQFICIHGFRGSGD